MGFSFAITGPECKIKYAVLDPMIIFNALSPEFLAERQKKSPQTYINDLNARNGFYEKLERSVLREGFRNPIIISAGWFPGRMSKFLPDHVTQNPKTSVLCLTNGGSRLWLAQKYKLQIPCVIIDYIHRFPEAKILNTDDEILDCYTDRPSKVLFGAKGLAVRDLPQVHMRVQGNEK